MREIILFTVSLAAVILLFTACKKNAAAQETPPPTPQQPMQMGNTDLNLRNWGYVAFYNGDIYYRDKKQIKKLDSNGETTDILSGHYVKWINVINDKIYFLRLEARSTFNMVWQICVMDFDGKNIKMLKEHPFISNLIVTDKYIYYRPEELINILIKPDFFRIDLDGKNIEFVTKNVRDIAIEGDWIYYTEINDKANIYKMRLDGTEKSKIFSDDNGYIGLLLGVYDGYIYYNGYTFVARINTNGDDYKVIFNDVKNEEIIENRLLIAGGYIFYYTDSGMLQHPTP